MASKQLTCGAITVQLLENNCEQTPFTGYQLAAPANVSLVSTGLITKHS